MATSTSRRRISRTEGRRGWRGLRVSVVARMCLLSLALTALLYGSLSRLMLARIERVERGQVQRDVLRAADALSAELGHRSRTAADWAQRDGIARYLQDHNEAHLEADLPDRTLINLDLNLMLFIDDAGRIAGACVVDLDTGKAMANGLAIAEALLRACPSLLTHTTVDGRAEGLSVVDGQPILLAARTITNSSDGRTIHGTLVCGRYVDDTLIAKLAAQTHLDVSVHLPGEADSPTDAPAAQGQWREGPSALVRAIDEQNAAGYVPIQGLNGESALWLRTLTPRTMRQAGMRCLRYLLASCLVLGLTVALAGAHLLERLVLPRLSRMSAGVRGIGETADPSRRLEVEGAER